jgi:hypothetical protein
MRAPGGTGGHPGERREEEGQGGSGKGEGGRASLGDEPSALCAAPAPGGGAPLLLLALLVAI